MKTLKFKHLAFVFFILNVSITGFSQQPATDNPAPAAESKTEKLSDKIEQSVDKWFYGDDRKTGSRKTPDNSSTSMGNNSGSGHSGRSWGNGTRITGEGEPITELRNLVDFTKIESGVAADIILRQAPKFKVEIQGQANILARVVTEVHNNTLKIRVENGYALRTQNQMKIVIEAPNFEGLHLGGSGNLNAETSLTGDRLKLMISGSSNTIIPEMTFNYCEISLSGSGNVTASGSATEAEVSISGSGDIKTEKLAVKNLSCSVSGSGNIICNTSDSLDAKISGSGNILYVGKPNSVKARVSGSGNVNARTK
jgi:hypothetical protein